MTKELLTKILKSEFDCRFKVLDNKILLEKSPTGKTVLTLNKYVEVLNPVFIDPNKWSRSKYYRNGFRWILYIKY